MVKSTEMEPVATNYDISYSAKAANAHYVLFIILLDVDLCSTSHRHLEVGKDRSCTNTTITFTLLRLIQYDTH